MSSRRASATVLAVAVALLTAPTALAQEATTPTTTTTTSTTTTTTTTPTAATTTDQTTTSTGTTTEPAQTSTAAPDPWAETARTRRLRRHALRFKATARRLSHLMQKPAPHLYRSPSDFDSLLAYRHWLRNAWRRRAKHARHRAKHPPHLAAWLCIHRWEGSWRDPNAPYFGGLQMDLSFQRAYGPALLKRKGTANHWAPYEQMWVAERALRAGRGFYPWPLTARRCGLI